MNNLTIIIKTVVLTALLHMVAPHATAWGLSPVMVGPERNSHIVLHEDCLNTDDDDDDDENVNITVDKDDLDGTEGDGTGENGGDGTEGTGGTAEMAQEATEQEKMAQEETEQAATPLTSKKSSCLFASTMRHSLPMATWW